MDNQPETEKMKNNYYVKTIDYDDTKDFILNKHYAQKMPQIIWAFGLFDLSNELQGICTIGKPPTPNLCKGIMGGEYKEKVYELNRLCINEGLDKNILSFFVGGVLKKLKSEDIVLVSYADEGMDHHGYIYQATNWLYTGMTDQKRTYIYTPNGTHPRHYTHDYENLRKVLSCKHRYIYFTGKSKKIYRNLLKYPILDYPKGDNKRYKFGDKLKTKVINTTTGEIFYE